MDIRAKRTISTAFGAAARFKVRYISKNIKVIALFAVMYALGN